MKNWKRLYNHTTQEERLEAILILARTIEARQNKRIFVHGQLVFERRRLQSAHFIGDRRGRYPISRAASLITFVIVLITVSVATWAVAFTQPIHIGAPAMFFHITALMGVFAFKPYNLRTQTTK